MYIIATVIILGGDKESLSKYESIATSLFMKLECKCKM